MTGKNKAIITLPVLLLILVAVNLISVRNWRIYTNTTHIYDVQAVGDKLYLATWGGIEVYDTGTSSFTKTYSRFDGLEDQNVKCLAYLRSSNSLLAGTSKAGVNILRDNRFIMPINDVIGLPDNKVNLTATLDSLIFVVTDEGLSVFRDEAVFPFPLQSNHVSTHNGLVSKNITALALSRDYVFVGTDRGLNVVNMREIGNPASWKLIDDSGQNHALPDIRITSLSIAEYPNAAILAIGTRGGIVRAQISRNPDSSALPVVSEWDVFVVGQSPLDANNIFNVFVDSSSRIWLSHGVWNESNLRIDFTRNVVITSISMNNVFTGTNINTAGLTTDQIMGFGEINGKIFAYTWGDGLFFLENGLWVNRQPNSMAANNITDISVDKNGKIWVCNGFIGGDAQMRANPGVSGFDGNEWVTFRKKNSPLAHDKVFRIMTDAKNRKWFGTWNHGISVYDEDNNKWYQYNRSKGLPANEIGALATDEQNNVWISTYSGGLVVLGLDEIEKASIQPLTSFRLYEPNITFSDVVSIFPTSEKVYFGSFYSGIRIWDAPVYDNGITSFPGTHTPGDAWKKPPVRNPSLSDGFVYVYSISSRKTHWGEEIWIASENGLFMHDTYTDRWYNYGTGIKRHVWLNNSWQRDRLYFVDEERLYGSAPTFPTAVLVDPFDRVWIGTEANGLTLYDLITDRFTIFNTKNSPLISDNITTLAYEPYSGNLFIGTTDGMNSVEIGKTLKGTDPELSSTVVFPNPFYPDKGQLLRIANTAANDRLTTLPAGKNECRIFNVAGELVITLKEDSYFEFSWNGNNEDGKKCGSGVYYYLISSPGRQTERGTIVLIR